MPTPNAPIERHSVVLQVRERLREDIVSSRLETDTLYSVGTIADELGVSRTPVREALLQLEQLGLVQFHRNRGFTVVGVTTASLVEIFQLRLALETAAARRVAGSFGPDCAPALEAQLTSMERAAATQDQRGFMVADRAFHSELLDRADNARARRAVADSRDALFSRGISASGEDRSWEDLVAEHRAILDAIATGDVAGASAAMATHLVNTAEALARLTDSAELPEDWSQGWVTRPAPPTP